MAGGGALWLEAELCGWRRSSVAEGGAVSGGGALWLEAELCGWGWSSVAGGGADSSRGESNGEQNSVTRWTHSPLMVE